ncbi:alpha/beta fold hydrolase [Maioricimonas rarisocia]|nr:alpha/beta fold hydrolase [Maioricimonas rarisocia]
MTTPLEHQFAHVEGHRLAYLETGSGPAVLLLHGIPTSSLLWRDVIPTLARSHRVIAPDMLNYGKSDKPSRADVSIAAQARLMWGLLDGLGIRQADVVAHDIGGGVAQIMAVHRPERVRRLVLSNSVCFDSWPIPDFEPLQKSGAEEKFTVESFQKMLREFLPKGVHQSDGLSDEAADIMLEPWSTEEGKHALFRNLRRLNPEYTMAIADELATLDHETLIVWGRHDPFQKPKYADQLSAAIPHTELAWIEEAAHWVMEERPEEVRQAIHQFLTR